MTVYWPSLYPFIIGIAITVYISGPNFSSLNIRMSR